MIDGDAMAVQPPIPPAAIPSGLDLGPGQRPLPSEVVEVVEINDPSMIESTTVLYGGRYELLSLVGAGAYGSVYRANDTELEEIVAVKALRPEHLSQPLVLSRFRREVCLARRVSHPNVARTYDIGSHHGERFLTMEYIDGQPLTQLCPIGAAATALLPLRLVIDIANQICAGLGALHAAGIIHRDMKTDNVLVGHDARVAITDFGIARTLKDSDGDTATDFLTGTPAYIAPEQVRGHGRVDTRADLYALGVMLYQMLTGQLPFRGQSAMDTALVRLYEPPRDPRTLRPQLPLELADLVLRSLQRDPDARFQSASELADALSCQRPPGPELSDFLKSRQRQPSLPSSRSRDDDASEATIDTPVAAEQPALAALSLLPCPRTISTAVLLFQLDQAQPNRAAYLYLASGLTAELIDQLALAPTLQVAGLLAVAGLRRSGDDAASLGQRLKVQVVVDGHLQVSERGLSATVRLIDVASGFLFAKRRFDRTDRNVVALAAAAAKEIGSLLTIALDGTPKALAEDAVAVDLYVRARHHYQLLQVESSLESVALLEQALLRLPHDPTLLHSYAMALTRLWFFGNEGTAARAQQAAERAVAADPERGEAYLGLAAVQMNSSQYPSAAQSLRQALLRAPRLTEAHELLGHLLGECGPLELAIRYLSSAMMMDGAVPRARVVLARAYYLTGRWADALKLLRSDNLNPSFAPVLWLALARMVCWQGDPAVARELLADPALKSAALADTRIKLQALAEQRVMSIEQYLPMVMRSGQGSPRGQQFRHQTQSEYYCYVGQYDRALDEIRQSVALGLPDITWMDGCPMLQPLRTDPAFQALRSQVAAVAQAIRRAFGVDGLA